MGLRKWLNNAGVEDFARDAEKHDNPRQFVYYTIDHAPFQWWVVFVAGVGFLTDAYDIFALNAVIPLLGFVYWDDDKGMPQKFVTALLCTTLAGTLLGQLLFGVLGDIFGRRRMYGLELIVLIVGSVGSAMASTGAAGSMDIVGWLVFWRLLMGIGIGADYPLSAVITAEFAPRRHRARMLAFVFWMQPLGQLLALVVALGVVAGYKKHIETTGTSNCMMPGGQGRNVECTKTLDSAWRWIVGLGAFPALFAISFRLMIPESPRYLMDVRRKVEAAAKQTHRYFEQAPSPEVYARNIAQSQPLKMVQYPSTTTSSAPANPMTVETYFSSPRATADDHDQHTTQTVSRTASMVESITYREPSEADMETDTDQEPRASLSDAKDYFITQGNWRLLLGTASTWFLLDIPFYGLGLSYATVVDTIFASSPLQDKTHLYGLLLGRLEQILIIISVGAVVGGAIFLKVIHYMSPKRIQFWGFIALAFLLLITGSAFEKLNTGLIVFYALIQLFFNLGPNTTTYIMSAELYPTRYRCTCHGISAAAGKLGAIIAQLIVQVPKFRDANWLGHGLQIFCAFMALGAAVTWLLTPETRDAKGKSRTLEELARGHKMFEEAREQAEDARRLET